MEPFRNVGNPNNQAPLPPPPPPPPPLLENQAATTREGRARLPPPPNLLQCPRCDSTNTKFCYYNNYTTTQPRYFCKACRRYWTQGGTLRNVPVGGGTRRNKCPSIRLVNVPRVDRVVRAQFPLPQPPIRAQNPTVVNSGQPSRGLMPIMPPMRGDSFSAGGIYAPSFVAGRASSVNLGSGDAQFVTNMSLLQAMTSTFGSQAPASQFPPPANLFSPLMNLPTRPLSSWNQNLISSAVGSSSSTVGSSVLRNTNNRTGPSFSHGNQWTGDGFGFNQ